MRMNLDRVNFYLKGKQLNSVETSFVFKVGDSVKINNIEYKVESVFYNIDNAGQPLYCHVELNVLLVNVEQYFG